MCMNNAKYNEKEQTKKDNTSFFFVFLNRFSFKLGTFTVFKLGTFSF